MLENLALRHQIGVLKRTLGNRRPHLSHWDRGLWVVLSRLNGVVLSQMMFHQPDTSIEGEGITVWDLSQVANKGPGAVGQLHVELLKNNDYTTDEFRFQHWCANNPANLKPLRVPGTYENA